MYSIVQFNMFHMIIYQAVKQEMVTPFYFWLVVSKDLTGNGSESLSLCPDCHWSSVVAFFQSIKQDTTYNKIGKLLENSTISQVLFFFAHFDPLTIFKLSIVTYSYTADFYFSFKYFNM